MKEGKHSTDIKKENKINNKDNKNKFNKFNFSLLLKIILLIVIILIISFLVYYFIKKSATSVTSNNDITNEISYETSETVSTKQSLVVKGADYLEIVGVYINSDNSKNSTVSTKIKNTSNEIHENIELLIVLLDENDNKITSLDCKIDKIKPNEEVLTYSALSQDLSKCVNYSISFKK